MVGLMAQYERHGALLDSHELPDHLCRYIWRSGAAAGRGSAWRPAGRRADPRSAQRAPAAARKSLVRCCSELLLKLANTQVDSQKVAEKIADEARDDCAAGLDAVWEEEQVKPFADQGLGRVRNFRSPASFCRSRGPAIF